MLMMTITLSFGSGDPYYPIHTTISVHCRILDASPPMKRRWVYHWMSTWVLVWYKPHGPGQLVGIILLDAEFVKLCELLRG